MVWVEDNGATLQDQFDSPLLRESELSSNATRYEMMIAAPDSNEDMKHMWTSWAVVIFSLAIYTTSVLVTLVFTPKIRQSPFNLFLIYLMIPDALGQWCCASSCLANALGGYFVGGVPACRFQSFYLTATIAANAWLNCAVARHLLQMLSCAKNFRKYTPPTRKRVTIEALAIYLYSCFLGCWFLFDEEWWPFKTRLTIGVACLPQDYDSRSTIFLYCIFLPLWFLGPMIYVCYAAVLVWRRKLMPKAGKRRTLAIYFFRLILAFLIMWVPCLILLFMTSGYLDPWASWVGGTWGHLQGAVSGVVSLWKPDIWDAYLAFYREKVPAWLIMGGCGCSHNVSNENGDEDHQQHHRNWEDSSFVSRTSIMSSFRPRFSLENIKSLLRLSNSKTTKRNSDLTEEIRHIRVMIQREGVGEEWLESLPSDVRKMPPSSSGGGGRTTTSCNVSSVELGTAKEGDVVKDNVEAEDLTSTTLHDGKNKKEEEEEQQRETFEEEPQVLVVTKRPTEVADTDGCEYYQRSPSSSNDPLGNEESDVEEDVEEEEESTEKFDAEP